MSKFEINRITIELIRAILRFRFSFPPPTMYKNNFQILFLYIVGGGKANQIYLKFWHKFLLKSTTEIQKKRTLT